MFLKGIVINIYIYFNRKTPNINENNTNFKFESLKYSGRRAHIQNLKNYNWWIDVNSLKYDLKKSILNFVNTLWIKEIKFKELT